QRFREMRDVLTSAARDLQHEAAFRQYTLQLRKDRLLVALGGRPMAAHVAAGHEPIVLRTAWISSPRRRDNPSPAARRPSCAECRRAQGSFPLPPAHR